MRSSRKPILAAVGAIRALTTTQVTMPLTYVIDASRRIIITRASGILTEDELRSSRMLMQGDPAFNRNFKQLFDLRAVTDLAVSVPAMARLAASSSFSPGVRRAFVAITDAQYNLAWTFAQLSEPHDQLVHVFREVSVAEAWLMEGTPPRAPANKPGPRSAARADHPPESSEKRVSGM